MAYARFLEVGTATRPGYEGCDILLEPPSEEWVLAQMAEDGKGTVAGRVLDEVAAGAPCAQCAGFVVAANGRIEFGQKWKFDYLGEWQGLVLPVQYKPTRRMTRHALLENDGWYQEADLKLFESLVDKKEIWLAHVKRGKDEAGKEIKGCSRWEWDHVEEDVKRLAEAGEIPDTPEDRRDKIRELLDQTEQTV